ncbi:MAG: hypothetical protein E6I97_11920 [Chloroflexi bacterium]|nr:MAG: hypothetical protein E6I97_11920 [Chloroflexota bacterium]
MCSRAWGLHGGFSSRARDAPEQGLALHPRRQWRRDDRRGHRLGSGAMPQTVERGALGPCS